MPSPRLALVRVPLGLASLAGLLCVLPGPITAWPFVALGAQLGRLLALAHLLFGVVLLGGPSPRLRTWALPQVGLAFAWGLRLAALGASAHAPLPWPAEAPGLDRGDVVVTYNAGNHLAQGVRLARWVARTRPDLLAVQELPAAEARALDAALPARLLPHRRFHGDGTHGKGVLSRWPISRALFLPGGARNGSGFLEVGVAHPAGELTVLVAHLTPPVSIGAGLRPFATDLDLVLERVRARRAPLLLLGDLNLTPTGGGWARIRSGGLADAWHRVHGARWGPTFPLEGRYHDLPVPAFLRLDYVFFRGGDDPRACLRGPDLGSDHRPLIVRW